MKAFTGAAVQEVQALLSEYPTRQSALLMVLRVAEREFGSLDDEAIQLVASTCGVSDAHVLGMVTFYTHFKRPFHGKHRLMVCSTLMCDLGGSAQVLEQIGRRLGIEHGERTADGLFSVEKVECLADCDKPTVMQVDRSHYVKMTPETVDPVIDALLRGEGLDPASYRPDKVKMDMVVPYIPVKRSVG